MPPVSVNEIDGAYYVAFLHPSVRVSVRHTFFVHAMSFRENKS